MKSILNKSIVLVAILTGFSFYAQNRDLSNYRQPDQRGVNVFEAPKDSVSTFDGVNVRIGGASTLQYQALDHENANLDPADKKLTLIPITNNFNLATANLDLDVALAKGVRMHLRTYLSSRHHTETYVKGGYFQIDNLDFISEGFLAGLMQNVTLKVGHMEINYGDTHFRRTDNAQAMYNPFVGNYIMDSFTTEVGAELYYQKNGLIFMAGLSNGKLNQDVKDSDISPSFVAKLGYDKQLNDDLRLRLTGSIYNTAETVRTYMYGGDRAGSRYYFVTEPTESFDRTTKTFVGTSSSAQYSSGRYNPGFTDKMTSIMVNPFVKYQGLEFFGVLEFVNGANAGEADRRASTQIGAELLYRFGESERLYIGGRYNTVNSEVSATQERDITRVTFGGGYFLTKNVLMKLEYVNQEYAGDGFKGTVLEGAKFNGFMLEAAISF